MLSERPAHDEGALTALYRDPSFFSVLRSPEFSGPDFSVRALTKVDCWSVNILFHKFWISVPEFSRYVSGDFNHSLVTEPGVLIFFFVILAFLLSQDTDHFGQTFMVQILK